ncbi:MAG TPA: S8 family serine peptidase [Streptosporangiaceae bacterium]|nr:S8 family serine peptidase [Streptosporangiaceae bacterium]
MGKEAYLIGSIGSFPSVRRRLLGITAALSLGTALAVSGGSLAHAAAGLGSGTGPGAPVMAGAASGGRVIVVLKDQFSGMNLRTQAGQRMAAAHSDQAPVVSEITAHGGTDVTHLVAPDAVAADLSAAEVSQLRGNAAVAEIVPDVPVSVAGSGSVPASTPVEPKAKVAGPNKVSNCPFNPAGTSKPLVEPEALSDIHAYSANPHTPDMANSIASGTGVIVGNMGANELAGNPNFTRADGSHVVIDAPDYTADHSNDEDYGDVSSIAAQGTVVYQYSGALPYSDVPPGCSFVIRGDAPGASVVDLSQVDTPVLLLSQVLAGIDAAATTVHADVISESFGSSSLPTSTSGQLLAKANEAAVEAGVTVVESSGDSGDSGTMIAAADDPLVIAAGAVDNFRLVALAHDYSGYVSNNMAALSSGGTAPTNKVVDLVAPGYFGGEAACADGSGGCPPNYPTESMRGTSESAPLIAGAAADVIQAYRDTHGGTSPTPAMVKEILTSTATDIDSPADQQGSGLLNVYAAVRAAQQMPGTTDAGRAGNSPGLVASPSQLDLVGNGGSVSDQTVSLYNTNNAPTTVVASYRRIGPEFQIGRTVTENVSAPPAGQPIPPEGAKAANTINFVVPPRLNRLDADMIWPDSTNSNVICFALFDPRGRLEQLSYDDGPPAANGRPGAVPDIQHATVTNPEPGRWTAKILWSGTDVDLALAPAVPGTYTGPMSFKVSGQNYISSPASGPVTIGARSSASVPLHIAMPVSPGDSAESVQFTGRDGAATSLPVTRRTLIPANGGSFQTLITSTVGRMIGQLDTYQISVPAGRTELDATFRTADASADNSYTFYLVDPSGTVVARATSPQTVNGTSVGTAEVDTANPVVGTWTIDVELNLTVSGKEFTQTVYGNVQDP